MSFMSINGQDLPVKVLDVEGRGPFRQIATLVSTPTRDGSVYVKRKIKERPLIVRIAVTGSKSLTELHQKVDEINKMLNLEEPGAIVFKDEPNMTYYGILNDIPDWEEVVYTGKGSLPFICPDPYKYGDEMTVSLDESPIMIEGTTDTPLIIKTTFNREANEFKISHSSGKFVRVIWNFVAGDILEIDLRKRKVTINNIIQMTAYDWRSIPFMLMPGANTLAVAPLGVATSKIVYRPRWL